MDLPKINLVMIGHKDHGKSTLIGRLLYDSNSVPEQKLQEVELKNAGEERLKLSFLLDTLEEERIEGLTIDVMQTSFKSKKFLYSIIDCPGHRELIKKMFTGASQADAAVLVVSAKEGAQDQTRQHALLAKKLGICKLFVAVNKMDLVDYDEERFEEICEMLRSLLNSIGYKDPPMIPVSASRGDNVFRGSDSMRWYNGQGLIDVLDSNLTPSALPIDKAFRACVQDTYRMGRDKIFACKVLTGTLKVDDTVCFDPLGFTNVVRKIESLGKEVGLAGPGDPIGVVLDGHVDAARGQVMSHPWNRAKVPEIFIAEVVVFKDMEIKTGDTLNLRCGTAEAMCRVVKFVEKIDPINLTVSSTNNDLKNGEVGKLVLSPIQPMCVEKFSDFPELGRFVILDQRGAAAAGIVVEVEAR